MPITQDNSSALSPAGSFNVTLGSATAGTGLLVVTIAGNTTVATPGGWTLRTSQVNNMGHYMWTKAGDGATSWAFSATGQLCWYIAEIENGTYINATSQNNVSSSTTYTTTSLTPTAGERIMLASMASLHPGGQSRTASTWLNSYVEESDQCQPTNDRPMQGTASLEVTANGSTAYSTGCTYSVESDSRSALHGAFGTSAGGGAPAVPPVLVMATARR